MSQALTQIWLPLKPHLSTEALPRRPPPSLGALRALYTKWSWGKTGAGLQMEAWGQIQLTYILTGRNSALGCQCLITGGFT